MEELQRRRVALRGGKVRRGKCLFDISVAYPSIEIGPGLGRELPYLALSHSPPLHRVEFPNTARPNGPTAVHCESNRAWKCCLRAATSPFLAALCKEMAGGCPLVVVVVMVVVVVVGGTLVSAMRFSVASASSSCSWCFWFTGSDLRRLCAGISR